MSSFFKSKVDTNAVNPSLLTPKSFGEVFNQNLDNHFNWHQTVGVTLNENKIHEDTYDEFNTLFPEANIQNPSDFLEGQIAYTPFGANLNNNSVLKHTNKKMHRDIKTHLDTLDKNDPRLKEYKGYDFYRNKLLEDMRASDGKTAQYNEYADGWVSKYLGSMGGMSVSAFMDPMFMATMPLTALSGGATIPAFLAREAVIGATIGLVGQSLVETKVYPFKQRVGATEYTLGTSAMNVAMVTGASALFAPAIAGTLRYGVGGSLKEIAKGAPNVRKVANFTNKEILQAIDKQLVKLKPEIKNRIIGREFNALVNSGADEARLLKYIGEQILALSPRNQLSLIQQLSPDAVNKTQIKQLEESIKDQEFLDIETVTPNNKKGRLAEIENQQAARTSLLNDEPLNVPNKIEAIVKPERVKITERNVKIADKIFKDNKDKIGTYDNPEIFAANAIDNTDTAIYTIQKANVEKINIKLKDFDDPSKIETTIKSSDQELDAYSAMLAEDPSLETKRFTVGTEVVNGELQNVTVTLRELIDDINNDKAIISRLKDCV